MNMGQLKVLNDSISIHIADKQHTTKDYKSQDMQTCTVSEPEDATPRHASDLKLPTSLSPSPPPPSAMSNSSA